MFGNSQLQASASGVQVDAYQVQNERLRARPSASRPC